MVERLSAWILSNRRTVIIFLAVMTGILGYSITRLRIVTDFEAFFLPHDPDLQSYSALKKSFGSDEFILIAYEATAEDVFTPTALKEVGSITRALESAPRVGTVISLTNAKKLVKSQGGIPVETPIVPGTELSQLQIAVIHEQIELNPFYKDFILAPDGKTTFLLIQMSNPNNENFVRLEMTKTIEGVVKPYDKGNIHVAGTPIYLTELYRLILDNLIWLGSASCALVLILLWFSLRSIRGVALPLLILTLSVIWNMGIFGLAGAPLTIASSVVAPLIVAISVTSSIHFLLAYTAFLQEGNEPRRALEQAMHHIIPPAFYSSFTTALGFLTLITAQVLPVVQTGLYTAVGVMASFILTITVLPIALCYFPDAPIGEKLKDPGSDESGAPGILTRSLDKIASLTVRHPGWIIAAWFLIGGTAVAGITMIRIETNPLTFFKKGTPIAKTHAYFEEKLGGTLPFDMIVQGKKGDFQRLENYPNLARLERFLEGLPELHGVIGTPDLMREIHGAMTDGIRALPSDRQTFQAESTLVDVARKRYPLVERFVDKDWAQARFTSRIQGMNSDELAWLIKKIDTYVKDNLDKNFEYNVAGIVKLLANMIEKVKDSQISSLGLAIGLLWICFIIFLRSPLLGTIAMIPNIVPIVVTLGLMGIMGIELDLATVMMPSIALGLAVDDTLHFFSAFRSRVAGKASGEEAIRWTLHFRGRAFIYTSFVLSAGFGILLASDLHPIADFGVISSAAIISALLADLFLNPALVRLFKPKLARWDSAA